MAGETFSVTVSFNHDVVAYEFAIMDQNSGQSLDDMLTPNADMDRPDFDEFTLEIDEPGSYLAELRHLGTRLDAQTFVVAAKPTPEGMTQDAPEEVEKEEAPVHVEIDAEEGFDGFIAMVETAKLRSDAQAMIAKAPAYIVHSNINAISRTLLGEGEYRNGYTAHCTNDGGAQFRVMLKPTDVLPAVGERFEKNVALHNWDVALKQLICREL